MISYEPFFTTIKRKGITQYQLENDYLLSKGTLDRLRNNKNISLYTLEYICKLIDCKPDEVFIIVEDSQ